MSGRFASLLAIVPMLIHSIWGCCWHHDHASPEHEHTVAAVVQVTHSHCSSHVGHSHPDDDQSPSEGPCGEAPCAYSSLSLTTAPQYLQLDLLEEASCAVVEIVDLLMPQQISAEYLFADSLPVSDGGRRALIQVWLI